MSENINELKNRLLDKEKRFQCSYLTERMEDNPSRLIFNDNLLGVKEVYSDLEEFFKKYGSLTFDEFVTATNQQYKEILKEHIKDIKADIMINDYRGLKSTEEYQFLSKYGYGKTGRSNRFLYVANQVFDITDTDEKANADEYMIVQAAPFTAEVLLHNNNGSAFLEVFNATEAGGKSYVKIGERLAGDYMAIKNYFFDHDAVNSGRCECECLHTEYTLTKKALPDNDKVM